MVFFGGLNEGLAKIVAETDSNKVDVTGSVFA